MHLETDQKDHLFEVVDNCSKWWTYSIVGSLYISPLSSDGVTTFETQVRTIEWRGKDTNMYYPDINCINVMKWKTRKNLDFPEVL